MRTMASASDRPTIRVRKTLARSVGVRKPEKKRPRFRVRLIVGFKRLEGVHWSHTALEKIVAYALGKSQCPSGVMHHSVSVR